IAANSGIKGEPSNQDWFEHGKKLTDVAKKAMTDMTPVSSGKLQVKMTTMTANLNPLYKPEGGSGTFLVSVITMGDVAFAATPYEMHDTNGMELKAASPFKMTFMCAYTNGNHGYMASSAAFENGGYEVNSSHFEKGTGEAAVAQLVSDLNTLYQTR
ncbi:MAG: hypothetical protein J6S44_01325, partial [Clostridia bacterium]|nr:hypothetical protein [Clostridia bacterium]